MATDTTKPEEPTVSDYDAMSSAFDELTAPEPSGKPEEGESTSVVDQAAADVKKETPEAPATETPAETPAPEGEAKPPEGAEKPAETSTSENEDWEARFKELEAKVTKQPEPQQQEARPPVETPPPDIYAADEKEFLATYEKDWPDVAKGEALRRRQEYGELVKHIFSEIARVYDPLVMRGAQAADTVAETTTLSAIRAAHADYDDAMYNDVLKWADGLTGTRKRVVDAVIAEGEPHELVELLTDFKSATGRKPRVVAGAAAPAAGVTELSAKAKQAAKALGVVDSKRTAPVTGQADPDDFDSAWNEALGSK